MKRRMMCFLLALCAATAPVAAHTDSSPTTGLKTTKPYQPVFAVISNSTEARPPWNLSEADIVFEAIYWGYGHTRYLALYNDNHPETVGMLRSMRAYHLELAMALNAPVFASTYAGRDYERHLEMYETTQINSSNFISYRYRSFEKLYERISLNARPHNLVFHVEEYIKSYASDMEIMGDTPYNMPGLSFSETPTKGETPAHTIRLFYDPLTEPITVRNSLRINPDDREAYDAAFAELAYEPEEKQWFEKRVDGSLAAYTQGVSSTDYQPMYTYNEETGLYDRWYNGKEQIDGISKERIVAANVLVLFMELTFIDNVLSQAVIETVGSGRMHAYIQGIRIEGVWQRNSLHDPFVFYTADGEQLLLLPGKTFIQVVSNEFIALEEADTPGSFRYTHVKPRGFSPF